MSVHVSLNLVEENRSNVRLAEHCIVLCNEFNRFSNAVTQM